MKTCPYCAEQIEDDATRCVFCQNELGPVAPAASPPQAEPPPQGPPPQAPPPQGPPITPSPAAPQYGQPSPPPAYGPPGYGQEASDGTGSAPVAPPVTQPPPG